MTHRVKGAGKGWIYVRFVCDTHMGAQVGSLTAERDELQR